MRHLVAVGVEGEAAAVAFSARTRAVHRFSACTCAWHARQSRPDSARQSSSPVWNGAHPLSRSSSAFFTSSMRTPACDAITKFLFLFQLKRVCSKIVFITCYGVSCWAARSPRDQQRARVAVRESKRKRRVQCRPRPPPLLTLPDPLLCVGTVWMSPRQTPRRSVRSIETVAR